MNGYPSDSMATIKPFVGTAFSPTAGDVAQFISQPSYRSPEGGELTDPNIGMLTRPASTPGDRSKYVKFAVAASTLASWRCAQILTKFEKPGFAIYQQAIESEQQAVVAITCLFCLVDLSTVVAAQEVVTSSAKEERLRLLEATNTNLEPIVGEVSDSKYSFVEMFKAFKRRELVKTFSAGGATHSLDVIDDLEEIQEIEAKFLTQDISVIGGHEILQAAMAHRSNRSQTAEDRAENYALFSLVFTSDSDFMHPASGQNSSLEGGDRSIAGGSSVVLEIPSGLVMWSLSDFVRQA